jgi:hypothetical protein
VSRVRGTERFVESVGSLEIAEHPCHGRRPGQSIRAVAGMIARAP